MMMKNYGLQKKQKVLFCKKVGAPWHPWNPRCRRPCLGKEFFKLELNQQLSEFHLFTRNLVFIAKKKDLKVQYS